MATLENILSQEVVQRLGWTLLHFLWQAAVIALLLAIVLAALRKSAANLRYIIACLALGLVVLLPIVTIYFVPVSTPQPAAGVEPAPAPVILPTEPTGGIPAAEMAAVEVPAQPQNAGADSIALWKQRIVESLQPALPFIVSGWLLGVFGLSVWHLGGWAQLQRLRRKMVRQVDGPLHAKLSKLSARLRVRRAVQLLESALVQVPTVVGWVRPVILLPASALTGLNTEQLEALLAHELAHIRRYDYLLNMLQTVVETLGFYHPAVWWISHKIRAERENCCDDLAVSVSGDRVRYARALTSMEEIRGRHGQLAVAASGGSLFGRVRRLVGKDSTDGGRTSWIPSVVTILLIAIIAIPTTLALTAQSEDKGDTNLETVLLNGFRANRDMFKRGTLAWTLADRHEGLSEGPRTETKGTFRMWWDGKKIATKYVQEKTDLDADVVMDKRTGGNVYNGSIFSRKPRFEANENWFKQVIHWTGPRSIDQEIPALRKRWNIAMDFSTAVVDGRKLLKVTCKNTDKAAVDYGAYTIRYFDPSRGYGLVNEEWYSGEDRLRLRFTYELREMVPKGWFPIDVVLNAFSLQDGKVYLRRHLALDLESCSFNDPSAIPDRIFDFSAAKEHEQLNDILQKFSDGTTADKSDNNSTSVRESVENYIAAALAGEDEKAAEYAYPDTAVVTQTKDMREILQGQDTRIVGMCIGEWNALAISSVIQADHGRTGSIVFHLKKVILDQKVNWLIDDIDLETPDAIGRAISYFLNNVPDAKTIIISADMYSNKQTETAAEDEVTLQAQEMKFDPDAETIILSGDVLATQRTTAPVEDNGSGESLLAEESPAGVPPAPVMAMSPAPATNDKAHVRVDCLVVEVAPNSKMDRETIIAIENLLDGKITIPDSPAAADLLRKAAGATAAVKDESAGDKRVTQEQLKTLVDMLVSRGFVKILMNPTLEVIDGQTAKIGSSQRVGSSQDPLEDSIQITPRVTEDGSIDLLAQVVIHQITPPQGDEQVPPVARYRTDTLARVNSGQSLILGGLTKTGQTVEVGGDAKKAGQPPSEILIILTSTIANAPAASELPRARSDEVVRIYYLQHTGSQQLAELLAPLLPDGKRVQISADEQRNRLIVQASKADHEKIEELILQLDVAPAEIHIETRILTVSDEFLEGIGLDANSVGDPNAWPEPAPRVVTHWDNLGTYSLLLNDQHVSFLVKGVQAHRDAKMLTAPRIMVLDGKEARFEISTAFQYVSGYSEPNRPGGEPVPKQESGRQGTFLRMTPKLRTDNEDNKYVDLDFESEIRQFRGLEERMYKEKYPYQIPDVVTIARKIRAPIPEGQTLLMSGQRITRKVASKSGTPLLRRLPLIGVVFGGEQMVSDERMLLILVTPTVRPPGQPEKLLAPPLPPGMGIPAPVPGSYGGYGSGPPPGPAGYGGYGSGPPPEPGAPGYGGYGPVPPVDPNKK